MTAPDFLVLDGITKTFGAFVANEADLQGLIDNFNTFTGALAAQSSNLTASVQRLAPFLGKFHGSLVELNRTLPPLRAWAIELTPAVEELPSWISAGKPWVEQAYPKLIHYNRPAQGGHFPAWEQPQLFSEELRNGFRSLR